MTGQSAFRGRPLVALAMIMVAWVGVRVAFWEPAPSPLAEQSGIAALQTTGPMTGEPDLARARVQGPQSLPGEGLFVFQTEPYDSAAAWPLRAERGAFPAGWFSQPRGPLPGPGGRRVYDMGPSQAWWDGDPYRFASPERPVQAPEDRPVAVRTAIAHQMLWMAAVSTMPLAMDLFSSMDGAVGPGLFANSRATPGPAGRWSADSWLLLRKGGNVSLASGVSPATYGASQAGAILRYRLAPRSSHRPAAYLRTTAALNGSNEREVALGLSARPASGIPVAVAAEVRATERPGGRQVRPAVLAWTEIPPFPLPLGARGEFYGQGGYVGGQPATLFADGQLKVDRRLAELGRSELRAGAGAWAGAQKGAARVDVGPTATMGVPISSTASARVGVDWRFRLAGNAEPRSGPALTLSAGF